VDLLPRQRARGLHGFQCHHLRTGRSHKPALPRGCPPGVPFGSPEVVASRAPCSAQDLYPSLRAGEFDQLVSAPVNGVYAVRVTGPAQADFIVGIFATSDPRASDPTPSAPPATLITVLPRTQRAHAAGKTSPHALLLRRCWLSQTSPFSRKVCGRTYSTERKLTSRVQSSPPPCPRRAAP
jgi:hypothetical protein